MTPTPWDLRTETAETAGEIGMEINLRRDPIEVGIRTEIEDGTGMMTEGNGYKKPSQI